MRSWPVKLGKEMGCDKSIIINITQEDIDAGKRKVHIFSREGSCPISLAIARHIPGFMVNTTENLVSLSGYGKNRDISFAVFLSEKAERFVRMFDKGYKVEPFMFEMALPENISLENSNAPSS